MKRINWMLGDFILNTRSRPFREEVNFRSKRMWDQFFLVGEGQGVLFQNNPIIEVSSRRLPAWRRR